MKVGYVSPMPPNRSGIADYSALLLPALEQRVEVTVVASDSRRAPRGVDVLVYHFGNNPEAHGWIVDLYRREPGVVVLHDFVLHHLVAGLTLGRGDRAGYLDAMQTQAGTIGRLLAHGVIDGLVPPLWETRPHEFPLVSSLIGEATGLIVHSRYVERAAREEGYNAPIWRIPHPSWPPVEADPWQAPDGGNPLIAVVGNLNASKRIPQLLQAFAALRRDHPAARLVLAGQLVERFGFEAELERFELGDEVIVLGRVDEARLRSVMAAADVLVSLRWPTMGETSGSAIRALGLGKPLVVSDVGWFSELPDSVALKVPVGEGEVPALAAALARLAGDDALRSRIGAEARAYVRREHDLDRVADLYVAALEQAIGGPAVRDEVLGEVARAAQEVGLRAEDPVVVDVARHAREAGLG